jgi:transcriptional regulator with XRE-family HTH domain
MVVSEIQKFGRNFRHAYESLGLTQADIAEKSGVDKSRISQILNGHVERVSLYTLEKLANAIGLGVGDLLRNHSDFILWFGERCATA